MLSIRNAARTLVRALYGSKRRKRLTNITTGLMLVGGTALAAWLITSEGQGGGKVGTLTAPVVTTATATGKALLPGGTGDLSFHIENDSGSTLKITNVGPATGGTFPVPVIFESGSSMCETYVSVLATHALATPIDVLPGGSDITIPDAVTAAEGLPTGCQGKRFDAAVKLTFST